MNTCFVREASTLGSCSKGIGFPVFDFYSIYHKLFVKFISSFLLGKMLEVVCYIIKSLGLSHHDQHPSCSLPIPVSTNRAIAEISAWRTFPVGIHQGFLGIFSIPDLQAPPTELSPHTNTLSRSANSLGVD